MVLLLTTEYAQLHLFSYMFYEHSSIYLTENYHPLSFAPRPCISARFAIYPIAKKLLAQYKTLHYCGSQVRANTTAQRFL